MPKARISGALCVCLMLAAACGCSGGDAAGNPYPGAAAAARSEAWKAINAGRCGSATAAIMVDGAVVYAEGFGMADREQGVPVTTATRFNIASISKMFVTTSIMMLADEGAVSLDRPVTDYLPQFRMADDRYRQITVRMLLNHSSGMPGGELANTCGVKFNPGANQETLDTLSRAHLKHAPGAMAEYCNDGFTVAELIVERVGKMPYLDFLTQRIFKPLGLEHTGMSIGTTSGVPVASYYDPATGRRHPLETISVLGSGGLSSTALDLVRFADSFSAEDRLLKKASLAEMLKPQPAAFQGKLRHLSDTYGLGWDLAGLPRYDAAGIRIVAKSGNSGNYSSYVVTVPDKRISVAVIASGPDAGAMEMAFAILDGVLADKKLMPKEEKPASVPPAAQQIPQGEAAFGGYYGNGGALTQVVFDGERNTVTLYSLRGHDKTQDGTLIYNGGYYYDAGGKRYYFFGAGGENYLVSWSPMTRLDAVVMQKIRPVDNPQALGVNMDNRAWLRRNVAPYEAIMIVNSHLANSLLYSDLPGYVFFSGMKRVASPHFAGMPFDAIGSQTELSLIEKNGAAWARLSDMLYSPAEAAVALQDGENAVTIGGDGYNEWMVAPRDMLLSFTKPPEGRIIVFGPDQTATYDSLLDTGETYAPAGSYVETAGMAGHVFTVRARPAAQ